MTFSFCSGTHKFLGLKSICRIFSRINLKFSQSTGQVQKPQAKWINSSLCHLELAFLSWETTPYHNLKYLRPVSGHVTRKWWCLPSTESAYFLEHFCDFLWSLASQTNAWCHSDLCSFVICLGDICFIYILCHASLRTFRSLCHYWNKFHNNVL